jgi:hypothetical protein
MKTTVPPLYQNHGLSSQNQGFVDKTFLLWHVFSYQFAVAFLVYCISGSPLCANCQWFIKHVCLLRGRTIKKVVETIVIEALEFY